MRGRTVCAAIMLLSVAACGADDAGPAGPLSPRLSTGTSSQGLAVSADAVSGQASLLTAAWAGRCQPRQPPITGSAAEQMEPGTFRPGALPATVNDRDDLGDVDLLETRRRHLEVRPDGDGLAGLLRVRVDATDLGTGAETAPTVSRCDTGEVTFTTRRITQPVLPPVRATAADFRAAELQETVYESLRLVHDAAKNSQGVRFCTLVSKRLARRFCRGGAAATGERIYQRLSGLDEVFDNDDFVARGSGGRATVVDLNDSGTSRFRFVRAGKRRWRLDAITLNGSPRPGSGGGGGGTVQRLPKGAQTGTTSQGLAVNLHVQDGVGSPDRVAVAWVGRCGASGEASSASTISDMESEDFEVGDFEGRRREGTSSRRRTTHERTLAVRPLGDGFGGRLRVRSRVFDRASGRVVSLCDSGPITFTTKPVDP